MNTIKNTITLLKVYKQRIEDDMSDVLSYISTIRDFNKETLSIVAGKSVSYLDVLYEVIEKAEKLENE